MSEREEVLLEPAYVLHQRPYRNTSLIVECLTGRYGRQTLVARGSRRAAAGQRSDLQPFRRIRISWVRRREMGWLTHVEADGLTHALRAEALYAGFYLNELLLRLVPRGDQNEQILSCYSVCLDRLADAANTARALRLFELGLLEALGYSVDLEHDCRTGAPIDPDHDYIFEHEGGLTVAGKGNRNRTFSGRDLISLRDEVLADPGSLRAARQLLGEILDAHLGNRPLRTRTVMRELVDAGLSR